MFSTDIDEWVRRGMPRQSMYEHFVEWYQNLRQDPQNTKNQRKGQNPAAKLKSKKVAFYAVLMKAGVG